MKKSVKAFIDGVVAGLVAHGGAWLAQATLDKLVYILGHIAIAVALRHI
jgi:hypothetical protein